MLPPSVPSVPAADVPPGATILDVREDDEWEAGHVDGALHVPMGQVPARLQEVTDAAPDGEALVVVCRSGGRSARVVEWLVRNGVDAVNLDGGMGAWQAAGRPMVSRGDAEPFVR